ncbi:TPA: LysM peptidoglycan-binding domain-containing protein, partial [Enterobacter cloacae]|nr:LysM peptidoglycan-binding domain-containing protein [Enterobacter cloacae]
MKDYSERVSVSVPEATAYPIPPIYRKLVWANIIVQSLLPISLALTPAITAASVKDDRQTSQIRTRPLILREGETVDDIAERYHLSVSQLKHLNQFRIFSKGFEQLSAGDEIDVPVLSAHDIPPEKNADTSSQTAEIGRWLSGSAASLAQSTSGPHHTQVTDAAMSQARSAAVSGGEAAVSAWLNQFGTARLNLGVDDHLGLNNSSLDMLVPLYDNGNDVFFTQFGGRRDSSRTTLNLGAGVRLFRGHWMYGVNTFLDNDITGHNRRIGVGGEAWTDYLKLSANSYLGMTDWHQSRDFQDYDERPANGFDVTANGWLPAYPQLGAKLKYEQYQGDHVGLMGKDTLQKNPRALTTGIEWTPVPLVTFGADYRNSSGRDETQLNAEFRWQFGESLHAQLSGDNVAGMRTLAGSRLDLVERNNNIILDYRKQELVKITLPEAIRGQSLSEQLLTATVTAKHGLSNVEWSAPELLASGGQIAPVGLQGLKVQLPSFRTSGSNQYVIRARAKDIEGNYSSYAQTFLTVDSMPVSASRSKVDFGLDRLPADGSSSSLITVTLRDEKGNPASGMASAIIVPFIFTPLNTAMNASPSMGGRIWDVLTEPVMAHAIAEMPASAASGGVKISVFKERKPGTYEAMLTAGVVPGTVTINPSVGEVRLVSKSITLGYSSNEYIFSKPILPSLNPVADGRPVSVHVPVITPDGKPVKNVSVPITVDGRLQTVMTDENGNAVVSINGRQTAGEYTSIIVLNGHSQSITLHFQQNQEAVDVAFGTAPKDISIIADGLASGHLTFQVLDTQGRGIAGEKVSFTVAGNKTNSAITGASGEVTLQLAPSKQFQDMIVVAELKNGVSQSVTVHFIEPPQSQLAASVVAANSVLTVSPASIAADDS